MSQRIDGQEPLPDNHPQALAMRYLLGTLSEEERSHFEERFFTDDKEFEELEIAEGELIDRYVLNELSADDTHRFKKLLASPRIAERVEVARILAKRASQPQQFPTPTEVPRATERDDPKPPWYKRLFGPVIASPAARPAFALGITLILLTSVAFVFVFMKWQHESQRLASEQQKLEELRREVAEQKARYGQLEASLKQTQQEKEEQQQLVEKYERQLAEQQRPTSILSFSVNPYSSSRGSGGSAIQKLTIPSNAPVVHINLNVTGGDYATYEALVQNLESHREVTKQTRLTPFSQKGGKYIRLKLVPKLLPPGSYNVRVNGIAPAGASENFNDYQFRVSSR